MRPIHLLRGVTAGVTLAALAACGDNSITPSADAREEIARRVEALGFRGDMVQDFGKYVIVEGDIHITKDEILAAPLPPEGARGPRFQYTTHNLVSSPKVNQITVNLTGLTGDWQTAAREALTHWSGISNSYVRMVEVTSGGDITVGTTCTSSNIAAYASFPSGGNPGSTVYVNSCFGYSTTYAQKLHNMVHEFGHTLGFRHSNYVQMGESAGTEGANHVPNTPTSGNDPGSAMNGGTALNAWAGFSSGDLTAVSVRYPVPPPPPPPASITVTNSGGYPLISWAPVVGATSYTVRRVIQFNIWNSTHGTVSNRRLAMVVGTTTSTSYLDTSQSYTGDIQCTRPADELFPNGNMQTETYQYQVVSQLASGTSTQSVYAPIGVCP